MARSRFIFTLETRSSSKRRPSRGPWGCRVILLLPLCCARNCVGAGLPYESDNDANKRCDEQYGMHVPSAGSGETLHSGPYPRSGATKGKEYERASSHVVPPVRCEHRKCADS